MQRCLQLAKIGAGNVAPNPMVGAVLVYDGKIIGEGFHEKFGEAHAEVNCLRSVKDENREFIKHATMYVSLEPCVHFGKTPPCADLIIENKIPEVVIGCEDAFEKVNGKGIEKLQKAAIAVATGILEDECKKINKRFFTFNKLKRPYIILKWAQTANNKISDDAGSSERLLITNDFTNRLVHKWRSEEAAILIGTKTALLDNPKLNNRLWAGNNPVRLVVDKKLAIPLSHKIFDKEAKTIVFNGEKHEINENLVFYKLNGNVNFIEQLMDACYQLKIQSIIVEGGARLLQSFIDAGLWDEARIITNTTLQVDAGLNAPLLCKSKLLHSENFLNDRIQYYLPVND